MSYYARSEPVGCCSCPRCNYVELNEDPTPLADCIDELADHLGITPVRATRQEPSRG